MTALWDRFTKAYPIQHDPTSQEQGALDFRYRAFLNCWHINNAENPDMWRLYTRGAESVVVVSTVRRLLTLMEKHQVVIGRVRYEPQSTPRPEWNHYAPFFFKDTRFMGERELRLLATPPLDQPVLIDTMFGLSLPIDPAAIIDLVKLHPNSQVDFKDRVKSFLGSKNTKLAVSKSNLRPMPLPIPKTDPA
jgi:hypothetical protein